MPSVTSGGNLAPSLLRSMVVAASAPETGRLVRIEGKMKGAKYREIFDENLLQSTQDLRLSRRITFQQDTDPKHSAKTTHEWLWDKSLNVIEWPSQSLDLNLIQHQWRDLKIALQRHSNLTELERICREEWKKLPKYRYGKLVASYPRRPNRCQRCFNKVLSKGSENLCKSDISVF